MEIGGWWGGTQSLQSFCNEANPAGAGLCLRSQRERDERPPNGVSSHHSQPGLWPRGEVKQCPVPLARACPHPLDMSCITATFCPPLDALSPGFIWEGPPAWDPPVAGLPSSPLQRMVQTAVVWGSLCPPLQEIPLSSSCISVWPVGSAGSGAAPEGALGSQSHLRSTKQMMFPRSMCTQGLCSSGTCPTLLPSPPWSQRDVPRSLLHDPG